MTLSIHWWKVYKMWYRGGFIWYTGNSNSVQHAHCYHHPLIWLIIESVINIWLKSAMHFNSMYNMPASASCSAKTLQQEGGGTLCSNLGAEGRLLNSSLSFAMLIFAAWAPLPFFESFLPLLAPPSGALVISQFQDTVQSRPVHRILHLLPTVIKCPRLNLEVSRESVEVSGDSVEVSGESVDVSRSQ